MRLRALLAVPFLAAFSLSAAEPPAKHPLTVDDIWAVVRVGRPVVSPDGKSVVYPRTTWEAEKNRNLTDLWLQPLAGGPGRRLTSHEAGESSPAYSPDGTRLAFVSKRDADKEAQLYVLRLDGGEAERWTEMPMAVQSPKWTADGKRIVFVSTVLGESLETTKAEGARREKDEKTRVKATVSENRLVRYWDHWLETDEWVRLFALDVESRKVTELTPGMKRLGQLDGTGLGHVRGVGLDVHGHGDEHRTRPTTHGQRVGLRAVGGSAGGQVDVRAGDVQERVRPPRGHRQGLGTIHHVVGQLGHLPGGSRGRAQATDRREEAHGSPS